MVEILSYVLVLHQSKQKSVTVTTSDALLRPHEEMAFFVDHQDQ